MMPDAPLLVASPSNVRLEPGQPGEAARPLKGLPEQSIRAAAGSNSSDAGYGDCRHCPSSWALTANGEIPPHADRRVRETRGVRPVCQGSGEAPVTRIEADDSRKGA